MIKRAHYRSERGQGLAEGAAGLVIFCMVFVGCLMLFINTVVLSDYYRKLQMAATEAAKTIDAQKYWLGAPRAGYDQATAEANARNLADFILESAGMPKTSSFKVDYPSKASNVEGQASMVLTRVTLSVNELKTVGGLFAPFIALSGVGISSNQAGGVYAYCTMALQTQGSTNTGGARQIYFPVYGVTHGASGGSATVFGSPGIVPPTYNPNITVYSPSQFASILYMPSGNPGSWTTSPWKP